MGSVNAGIPFVRFLCILSIYLTAKQLGVNCEIKFVCRLKCWSLKRCSICPHNEL